MCEVLLCFCLTQMPIDSLSFNLLLGWQQNYIKSTSQCQHFGNEASRNRVFFFLNKTSWRFCVICIQNNPPPPFLEALTVDAGRVMGEER